MSDFYKYNDQFKSLGSGFCRAIRYQDVEEAGKSRSLASRVTVIVRGNDGVTASMSDIVGENAIRALKEQCEFALENYQEPL